MNWLHSIALVVQIFSDGIAIKISFGVDVLLHQLVSNPIFSCLVAEVRSVETDLGSLTLVVAVISVNDYILFGFLKPEDARIGVFWLHCVDWE